MTPDARDREARADLMIALGETGSGKRRYAAAMRLYRRGLLSADALEVYRICAGRDADDPVALLHARGLAHDIVASPGIAPAEAIHRLVAEIDHYLATLAGPGIDEVRAGLARWREGAATPARNPPNPVVAAHLPGALGALRATHPALAEAIAQASSALHWITYDLYPAEEIGAAFGKRHAYASLVGADHSAVPAVDFDLGLFVIAPDVLYRDHAHPAPELYAPLTGPHGWRFAPGATLTVKPAHAPVWNLPNQPHLTKVGPVPFLCIYGWTRDVDRPARVLPASDWAWLEALRIGADGAVTPETEA